MTEKERKKKKNANEEEAEKVCAFYFILCGFIDFVCFRTEIANLGLRRRDKKTNKMAQSGKTIQFYRR